MRHDQLVFIQEHVANGDGLVEQPPVIASHVQNQAIEGRRVQLLHRVAQLAVGFFVESGKFYVADSRLDLEGQLHGVVRDFIAHYCKNQRIGVTLAGNCDLDQGAPGSSQ